jgi:transposase
MMPPRGSEGNFAAVAFSSAHLRRRFYEMAGGGTAPIAKEALVRIAALYRIEREIRRQGPDLHRAVRQARSQLF